MTAPVSTELIVADAVVAGVAAWAAARVPGVKRVEPGLRGLVAGLSRAGRQLWSGYESASTDGVRVRNPDDGALGVRLEIAIGADRPAPDVGAAVQRAVIDTVFERLGVTVDEVTVTVIDIEPESR
ncbi:Asp23/Gls24 family envelope stress response protein [Nocardia yunnanensis]|uniref:Asp23/Gls24 family envelope stress response protein n=1 Tax=Nocardia yunnanensis TaxID=2382165 RepID=A0A386ZH10_9NOCA|nr:Asp23/Gls24 family envelope stress response protein [Nocardia yunnanensis]AYF76680.1 Asp23/Gls24 family envelope stress response protein [Nocardia yunnanensis]